MKNSFAVLLACSFASAQSNMSRPEFEVASIKPSSTYQHSQPGGPGTANPRYYRVSLPLSFFVKNAYRLTSDQYVGPPWMDKQNFEVNAKVPDGATKEQLRDMLQVLLEKRFKLKFHREKKEAPAYKVVVAKGGPKLKTSAPESIDPNWVPPIPTEAGEKLDQDGFPILPGKRGSKMVFVSGGARIRAYGQPMERIAGMLTGHVGRRVIDGTGLTGHYDFTLAFSTRASAGLPPDVRGRNRSPG